MKKILLLAVLVLVGAYVYSQRRSATAFKSVGNAAFAEIIADTTVQLVDVRTPAEYAAGHIPGAVNIDVRGENFDHQAQATLDIINQQNRLIRGALGRRMRFQVKVIPELQFFIDDSLEYIENIDNLLKE